uniref:Uncharacterized protein n=1 Tax=Romanomermis culicivorax TaxID=13658 RepID=A0A915KS06_ROMCU
MLVNIVQIYKHISYKQTIKTHEESFKDRWFDFSVNLMNFRSDKNEFSVGQTEIQKLGKRIKNVDPDQKNLILIKNTPYQGDPEKIRGLVVFATDPDSWIEIRGIRRDMVLNRCKTEFRNLTLIMPIRIHV